MLRRYLGDFKKCGIYIKEIFKLYTYGRGRDAPGNKVCLHPEEISPAFLSHSEKKGSLTGGGQLQPTWYSWPQKGNLRNGK